MESAQYYKNDTYINSMAKAFDVLANIFYKCIDEDLVTSLLSLDSDFFLIDDLSLNEQVKEKVLKIKLLATNSSLSLLKKDFNALFINPKGKLAYPWGSVYLSNDNRLFGESTFAFANFCKNNNILLNLPKNEPLDHFGVMLVVVVHCLESELCNNDNLTKNLLEQHILIWSDRFLSLVIEHSSSGLYRTAAELCLLLLNNLKQQYHINIIPISLFK
ncbi:molecular chaperone [Shewanella sp. MEBiC00475]|uniref:TorD/DmsD family molecular chaperone n=1 Tax=Shewanella sp. MEBiC00475 TaxID=2575361 RepID=UPI0010BF9972|nr:molecular chaperone TorD family protein [Shewanella sp. MEBiC00475]